LLHFCVWSIIIVILYVFYLLSLFYFFAWCYFHAIDIVAGGLADYWDKFWDPAYPRLQGGFIWDFVDQGLVLGKFQVPAPPSPTPPPLSLCSHDNAVLQASALDVTDMAETLAMCLTLSSSVSMASWAQTDCLTP
jgi:hypothetical protein